MYFGMNSFDLGRGFFPDEVILQILARLPVKSLFRFKTVCKYWCRIPSDRYFMQLYNEISMKNPLVLVEVTEISEPKSSLICVDFRGVSEFSLDFLKDRVRVRASCNGLLCCSSIPEKGLYYVCNPTTREFKALPRNRERPVTRFCPDGEATLVGVACDLSSTKFSVVLAGYHRSFGHRHDNKFVCIVYDSWTNNWRKFVSFQDDNFTQMSKNQVVFLHGALHWLTLGYSCILVLDLENDVWKKIQLPDEMIPGVGNRMYLFASEGCLSVVQITDAWMNIWVLKDYERGDWRMVERVSLRCIKGLAPGIFPISLTGEFVFLATHKQVLFYHRRTRAWKVMYSVKSGSTLPLWFSAHPFRSMISSCR